jgi:hypothetical protein
MTDRVESPGATADPLWRMRWMLSVSMAITILCLLLLRTDFVDEPLGEWHWSLFWWGVIVGIAGALLVVALTSFALRLEGADPDRREWMHRRRLIYGGCWVYIGVLLGIVASMFELPWLIFGMIGYMALTLVVGAALVRHKLRHAPS